MVTLALGKELVDLVHLGLSPFEGVRILLQNVVVLEGLVFSQSEETVLSLGQGRCL